MPLARLFIENYRCFRDRQYLDVRPITVVLGKNNSGKSALVRSPMILEAGVRNTMPIPFDLERLGESASDFVDLIHNRVEHGSLTVGFELAGQESVSVEATVQNIDEW